VFNNLYFHTFWLKWIKFFLVVSKTFQSMTKKLLKENRVENIFFLIMILPELAMYLYVALLLHSLYFLMPFFVCLTSLSFKAVLPKCCVLLNVHFFVLIWQSCIMFFMYLDGAENATTGEYFCKYIPQHCLIFLWKCTFVEKHIEFFIK